MIVHLRTDPLVMSSTYLTPGMSVGSRIPSGVLIVQAFQKKKTPCLNTLWSDLPLYLNKHLSDNPSWRKTTWRLKNVNSVSTPDHITSIYIFLFRIKCLEYWKTPFNYFSFSIKLQQQPEKIQLVQIQDLYWQPSHCSDAS